MTGSEDVATQIFASQAQAKVLARRGQHTEAESLAREAVAGADATDSLVAQPDARCEFGEVLEAAG
jgi:hypothetical protein